MREERARVSDLTRMVVLAIGGLSGMGHAGAQAAAPESAYSTFDWDKDCEVLDAAPADEPGEWVRLKCPGYGSYPVFVVQDDQRMSVGYGSVDPESMPWESFQGFNYVSQTVEWRLMPADGEMRPFATIHRWFVSQNGDERPVLVVSMVAQRENGKSCPVALVDAGANMQANRLARELADTVAPDFTCGEDEARFHGRTEPDTPRPVIAPSN